uniref:Ion transport domain-containing protein n=1 Tax=Chromera velia CCMP2878 TaxID=1169474 RepID=A0A0G4FTS0_9ALVE|eukprot:Cvel_3745.t1-p1 / transcript=Cvel_3745.t1 / gene=Cvel_3745 / organism=Chromera_velia_CCMP2878 / gene_product=Two pore calcium channel protein 1, putative / transcript_product=Two pore calcium channel protein 1, putative / location=Cvel_scaffold156:49447-63816(+) / protein_length=1630 / sequence_SO=supercontig / SO=protein_coding / is_pseudo=false
MEDPPLSPDGDVASPGADSQGEGPTMERDGAPSPSGLNTSGRVGGVGDGHPTSQTVREQEEEETGERTKGAGTVAGMKSKKSIFQSAGKSVIAKLRVDETEGNEGGAVSRGTAKKRATLADVVLAAKDEAKKEKLKDKETEKTLWVNRTARAAERAGMVRLSMAIKRVERNRNSQQSGVDVAYKHGPAYATSTFLKEKVPLTKEPGLVVTSDFVDSLSDEDRLVMSAGCLGDALEGRVTALRLLERPRLQSMYRLQNSSGMRMGLAWLCFLFTMLSFVDFQWGSTRVTFNEASAWQLAAICRYLRLNRHERLMEFPFDFPLCAGIEAAVLLVLLSFSVCSQFHSPFWSPFSPLGLFDLVFAWGLAADLVAFIAVGDLTHARALRMFRPLGIIRYNPKFARLILALLRCIPFVLDILVLMALVSVMFFLIGLRAGEGCEAPEDSNEEVGGLVFSDSESLYVNLLGMFSLDNYPDIAQTTQRLCAPIVLYILVYGLIAVVLILNVPVAVVIDAYKQFRTIQLLKERMHEKVSLFTSFRLADLEDTGKLTVGRLTEVFSRMLGEKRVDAERVRTLFSLCDENVDSWLDPVEFLEIAEVSLWVGLPYRPLIARGWSPWVSFRKFCNRWFHFDKIVKSSWFEAMMMIIVTVNVVLLVLDTVGYFSEEEQTQYLEPVDLVFFAIFGVEAILKIIGLSVQGYFSDGWNVLDFSILMVTAVTNSLYAVVGRFARLGRLLKAARILRTGRALRLLRYLYVVLPMFSTFTRLFDLVQKFFVSIPAVLSVLVVIFTIIYLYAAMGLLVFGMDADVQKVNALPKSEILDGHAEVNLSFGVFAVPDYWVLSSFESFPAAVVTLMQIPLSAGWVSVLFFMSAFVLIFMLGLSVLTSVLIEVFSAMEDDTKRKRRFKTTRTLLLERQARWAQRWAGLRLLQKRTRTKKGLATDEEGEAEEKDEKGGKGGSSEGQRDSKILEAVDAETAMSTTELLLRKLFLASLDMGIVETREIVYVSSVIQHPYALMRTLEGRQIARTQMCGFNETRSQNALLLLLRRCETALLNEPDAIIREIETFLCTAASAQEVWLEAAVRRETQSTELIRKVAGAFQKMSPFSRKTADSSPASPSPRSKGLGVLKDKFQQRSKSWKDAVGKGAERPNAPQDSFSWQQEEEGEGGAASEESPTLGHVPSRRSGHPERVIEEDARGTSPLLLGALETPPRTVRTEPVQEESVEEPPVGATSPKAPAASTASIPGQINEDEDDEDEAALLAEVTGGPQDPGTRGEGVGGGGPFIFQVEAEASDSPADGTSRSRVVMPSTGGSGCAGGGDGKVSNDPASRNQAMSRVRFPGPAGSLSEKENHGDDPDRRTEGRVGGRGSIDSLLDVVTGGGEGGLLGRATLAPSSGKLTKRAPTTNGFGETDSEGSDGGGGEDPFESSEAAAEAQRRARMMPRKSSVVRDTHAVALSAIGGLQKSHTKTKRLTIVKDNENDNGVQTVDWRGEGDTTEFDAPDPQVTTGQGSEKPKSPPDPDPRVPPSPSSGPATASSGPKASVLHTVMIETAHPATTSEGPPQLSRRIFGGVYLWRTRRWANEDLEEAEDLVRAFQNALRLLKVLLRKRFESDFAVECLDERDDCAVHGTNATE